jgi:hypothetical protein
MGGHVFGDDPQVETAELERVTRPGGIIILCPGGSGTGQALKETLVGQGYQYSFFEEPGEDQATKVWKNMPV